MILSYQGEIHVLQPNTDNLARAHIRPVDNFCFSCCDVVDLGIGTVNQGMGSNPAGKRILRSVAHAWLQRGRWRVRATRHGEYLDFGGFYNWELGFRWRRITGSSIPQNIRG